MSKPAMPVVGETVTVQMTGEVMVLFGDDSFRIDDAAEAFAYARPEHIIQPPAPREPWTVLREAADILPGYEDTARFVLRTHATQLEAAARHKPTLAVAAANALHLLKASGQGDTYEACALREALARVEQEDRA